MPMQVYAAGFDQQTRRPRVGLLLAGVGLNQADSEAAIRTLPGGVTLAISPYARIATKLLAAARAAEHEYLLSIPMEPQGFPLNDPGPQALMTTLSRGTEPAAVGLGAVAHRRLCGATGALGNIARRAVCRGARSDAAGPVRSWRSAACCMSIRDPAPRRCRWYGTDPSTS